MEQLLKFCLRELSYDGDLGCRLTTWPKLVEIFFQNPDKRGTQVVDNEYVSYVWKFFVRHPGVVVGLRPPGAGDVWVAPQQKSKATEKVSLIPIEDELQLLTYQDLVAKYKDKIHVAATRDAIFEILTGSHVQPSKLSEMAYTALQFITRARDKGCPVDDITKATGYQSGTTFYLVKVLTELNLVLKLRSSGQSMNIAIHRYFWERSTTWQQIHAEEIASEQVDPENADTLMVDTEQDFEENQEDAKIAHDEAKALRFEPIDARFLSSAPLVRARIIKLLKRAKNNMHAYTNLMLAVGCVNPTRTDRRFFIVRIREGIQDGLWEKIYAPGILNHRGKRSRDVLCLRLLSETANPTAASRALAEQEDRGDAELEQDAETYPLWNVSIQRQVIGILEDGAQTGTTLNAISDKLGQFDRRTIEHLLTNFTQNPPPHHLQDLGITEVLQHYGRERRHEYWTIPWFKKTVSGEDSKRDLPEALQVAVEMDLSETQGFNNFDSTDFYDGSPGTLGPIVDDFDRYQAAGNINKRARQRKAASRSSRAGNEAPAAPRKRGRPPKAVDSADDQQPKVKRRKKDPQPGMPAPSLDIASYGNVSPTYPQVADDAQQLPISAPPLPPKRPRVSRGRKSKLVNERSFTEMANPTSTNVASESSGQQHVETNINGTSATTELLVPSVSSPGVSKAAALATPKSTRKRSATNKASNPPAIKRLRTRRVSPTTSTTGHDETAVDGSIPALITDMNTTALNDVDSVPKVIEEARPAPPLARTGKTKAKITGKPRDLNALRRRNELLQVLKDMGGTANTTTQEFVDNHSKHLARLESAASAPPGTVIDKRTMKIAIDQLTDLGLVNKTVAMVRSANSEPKECIVISLPNTDPSDLQRYVASLTNILAYRPPAFAKITSPVDFGRSVDQRGRFLQGESKPEVLQAEDDPEQIRAKILDEQRVIIQSAGYITGRYARAKELHMFLLSQMEDEQVSSTNFVSPRIFRTTYLWEDIPVGIYCALVSVQAIHASLTEYLSFEENRWTPSGRVPAEIKDILKVGRTKSRKMIRDTLELLQILNVITPLTESSSNSPDVTQQTNDGHVMSFDIATDPTKLALYWAFSDSAPMYKFYQMPHAAPFIGDFPLSTSEERLHFWDMLQRSALFSMPELATQGDLVFNDANEFSRSIRKHSSWTHEYAISHFQRTYLTSLVDPITGKHPLDDQEALNLACYITEAPPDVVRAFVEQQSVTATEAVERIKIRKQKEDRERNRRQEARGVLARKAAEVKAHLEHDWHELVRSVHPAELPADSSRYLEPLHKNFMQSGGRLDGKFKLEQICAEIQEALRLGSRQGPGLLPADVAARSRGRIKTSAPTVPPRARDISDRKSVYDLIKEQEPIDEPLKATKKAKGTATDIQGSSKDPQGRRRRFRWNDEMDELALDAAAIIRSRCRQHGRVEWEPARQVFPGVNRNGFRNRVSKLVKSNPGYARRLETAWHHIWLQSRGSRDLSDPLPDDVHKFDLAQHVDFLRNRVDKTALRSGALDDLANPLPSTMEGFLTNLSFNDSGPVQKYESKYDYMFAMIGDEAREKPFVTEAFTQPLQPETISLESSNGVGKSKAVIKMTLSTEAAKFSENAAARLLRTLDTDLMVEAHSEMRKVFISQVEFSKRHPGRGFKYQDWQFHGVHGSIPVTQRRDATDFEKDLYDADEDEWLDWPLVALDGHAAAIAELVSAGHVEMDIAVPDIQAVMEAVLDNSKKITDEQIEPTIMYRSLEVPTLDSSSAVSSSESLRVPFIPLLADDGALVEGHGSLSNGRRAACATLLRSDDSDVIDCSACIKTAEITWRGQIISEDSETFDLILETIRAMSSTGISVNDLGCNLGIGLGQLHKALRSLLSISLIHLVGHTSTPLLIASEFARPWLVTFDQSGEVVLDDASQTVDGCRLIFPRRWRDIRGAFLASIWDAGVNAVQSQILARPGISEVELFFRMQDIFDRPEVVEILGHLHKEGFIKRLFDESLEISNCGKEVPIGVCGETEARRIYWFATPGEHWWHVKS